MGREANKAKAARREMLCLIQSGLCGVCGSETREPTFEHVVPKHAKGRLEPNNLIMACRPCNNRRGGRKNLITARSERVHRLVAAYSEANGHESDVRHWTVRPDTYLWKERQ